VFERLPGYPEEKMRVSGQVFLCSLAVVLLLYGCSSEETDFSPPRQTQKVMKTAPDSEAKKPTPAPAPAGEEKKAATVERVEEKPVAEEKKAEAPKPAAVQGERKGVEGGYYVVNKGDTLAAIAARDDVYQDRLKWPILVRFNLGELATLPVGPDFHERELPPGMRMKIVLPRSSRPSGKKGADPIWVVNVLSSKTDEKIVPPAVALIKEGYPVYIARGEVKGAAWMRLRVGFFRKRAEADELGKKIKDFMKYDDSWTGRPGSWLSRL